eukprot:5498833-Pleurochrysis_carterae.AAC.3
MCWVSAAGASAQTYAESGTSCTNNRSDVQRRTWFGPRTHHAEPPPLWSAMPAAAPWAALAPLPCPRLR